MLAYYGGAASAPADFARGLAAPPGSSFKPYMLAEALERGHQHLVGRGTAPRRRSSREPRRQAVRNSEGDTPASGCTLMDAMRQVAQHGLLGTHRQLGDTVVRDFAGRAGVTTDADTTRQASSRSARPTVNARHQHRPVPDLRPRPGQRVRHVRRQRRACSTATSSTGSRPQRRDAVHSAGSRRPGAFSKMSPATPPTRWSRSPRRARTNRSPAAARPPAKTGTQQWPDTDQNSHAWMCGFTPQVSRGGLGRQQGGREAADRRTDRPVYGSGFPARSGRTS